jgi:hypothetical protein
MCVWPGSTAIVRRSTARSSTSRRARSRGHSAEEAEGIGYATVNKRDPEAHRYSAKEKRQAEHIMDSEEERGKSEAEAKRIAYATVNKLNS